MGAGGVGAARSPSLPFLWGVGSELSRGKCHGEGPWALLFLRDGRPQAGGGGQGGAGSPAASLGLNALLGA